EGARWPKVNAMAVHEQGVTGVGTDADNRSLRRRWQLDCAAEVDVQVPRPLFVLLRPAPPALPIVFPRVALGHTRPCHLDPRTIPYAPPMSQAEKRPDSPNVALFITCLTDQFYPRV